MVQWSKNNEKTSIQLRRSGAPLPQIIPESAPCCPGALYCLGVSVGGWLKLFRNAFLAMLRNSCCMDHCWWISYSFINHPWNPWFFSRLIDVDSMDDIGGSNRRSRAETRMGPRDDPLQSFPVHFPWFFTISGTSQIEISVPRLAMVDFTVPSSVEDDPS